VIDWPLTSRIVAKNAAQIERIMRSLQSALPERLLVFEFRMTLNAL
jgi:hypothetical protein